MLDTPDIALLSIVGLELLAFGFWNWLSIHREEATAQKYRLYKVRDDLVYLVAEEKLAEEDELFQLFYGFTNHLIKTTKKTLSLKTIVEGVSTASENPAEERRLERVLANLKDKDSEVVQTVDSLFLAVIEILLENSLTLRVLNRSRSLFTNVSHALRPLVDSLLPRADADAQRVYRQYTHASRLLHA
jgi:hypothetical protein